MTWSTDLVETLERVNLTDQAAQVTYSAVATKKSRGTQAHEDFPERDDEN